MSIEFITSIYAFLTFFILISNIYTVREMRKQNESILRPYVLVSAFIPSGSIIIYLRIKNHGKNSASTLKLSVDRDFFQYGVNNPEDNLKSFPCFNNTIPDFPANSEIVFALAQSFVIFDKKADISKTPKSFVVTAKYNWAGKHFNESTTIDLSSYLGSQSDPDPIHEELKGIKYSLTKIQEYIRK